MTEKSSRWIKITALVFGIPGFVIATNEAIGILTDQDAPLGSLFANGSIPEVIDTEPDTVVVNDGPSCVIEAIAVRDKSCGSGFQYAGAVDANAHGGHCVRIGGCDFYAQHVRARPCSRGVYVGPLDAGAHGGTCLVLEDERFRLTATSSNDPCPRGTTHVGPINQQAHGGRCLKLQSR